MDKISFRSPHNKNTIKLISIEQSPSVSKEFGRGKGFYYSDSSLLQDHIGIGTLSLFARVISDNCILAI